MESDNHGKMRAREEYMNLKSDFLSVVSRTGGSGIKLFYVFCIYAVHVNKDLDIFT